MSSVSLFTSHLTLTHNGQTIHSPRAPENRLSQLFDLLRLVLPRMTSHRNAMIDLAGGYDQMADRAAAKGDVRTAAMFRECAAAIRQNIRPTA